MLAAQTSLTRQTRITAVPRNGRRTNPAFAAPPLTPHLSPEYQGEGVAFRPVHKRRRVTGFSSTSRSMALRSRADFRSMDLQIRADFLGTSRRTARLWRAMLPVIITALESHATANEEGSTCRPCQRLFPDAVSPDGSDASAQQPAPAPVGVAVETLPAVERGAQLWAAGVRPRAVHRLPTYA